jgi:hypothetical protein
VSLSFAGGMMATLRRRITAAERAVGLSVEFNSVDIRAFDAAMQRIGQHSATVARSAVLISLCAIPAGRFMTTTRAVFKPTPVALPSDMSDEELGHLLACMDAEVRAAYLHSVDAPWSRMSPPQAFATMAATPPPEVEQFLRSEVTGAVKVGGNSTRSIGSADAVPLVGADVDDLDALRERFEAQVNERRAREDAIDAENGIFYPTPAEAASVAVAAERVVAGASPHVNAGARVAQAPAGIGGVQPMAFVLATFTR